MKKKLKQLIDTYEQNRERISQIADGCESEKRERTEAEEAEYTALRRENAIIRMKIEALNSPAGAKAAAEDPTLRMREILLRDKQECRIVLQREEMMTSADLDGTGIIPVAEQQMLAPLRAGLIYDKLGLSIPAGLVAGKLRWPKHGKATAKFANEAERATSSKIDFSKLETKPHRLTCAIPATNEELESSEGLVETVIRSEMPAAVIDVVNSALFATSATGRKVYGPFVKAAQKAVKFAGEVPTRKELLKIKATVAATGIKMVAPCWVMTENMKAELEDLKVDAGSGRFVCEEDKILGYPVFTTPEIGEGNIGFGDWSYQPAGFFGQMAVVVDPYTLLRENATDFVLNTHFATVTLYDEAFVLGQTPTAAAATAAAADDDQSDDN